MALRVSYYLNLAKPILRVVALTSLLSLGVVPGLSSVGVLRIATLQAKPMPAIEAAWVALQAQMAFDALDAAGQLNAIEQRDVATRWINSIAVIVATHLEVSSKELEQIWWQSDLSRQKALFAALTQLGVPYKTNADQPGKALDCSALIKFAWSTAGVPMPRGSAQQYASGERIKSSEVQLGDLGWYPGHILMSLGLANLVIQAPTNGRSVEVHKIDASRINWVRWVDPIS